MYRFAFNLLPEKPKEEIVQEEKRENTSLMIAFLPLLAVILSIGLMLFNNIVVRRNVNTWENALNAKEIEILSYQPTVLIHKEFVSKTELLKSPVELDTQPQKFFDISRRLVSQLDFNIDIVNYGRNSDGSFDLVIVLDNEEVAGTILRVFEGYDDVERINMKNLSINQVTKKALLTISFFVIDN